MQERRLAAIMPARRSLCEGGFTDIVGYTALMGSDEDRAFEVLGKNCEIHTKLIEQFGGTLIKEMGDRMLASFINVSDEVYYAAALQNVYENKK